MRKFISVLLIVILMISVCIVSVSAVPAPYYYGDADTDGDVNIFDATIIQRALAQLETMSALQRETGDVDGDDDISILDATTIQRKLAKLIDVFPVGSVLYYYVNIDNFYCDYGESKPMVGAPVTFTTVATGYYEPYTYEYYVNDEIVSVITNSNVFTHTFDEIGYYDVKVVVTNAVGYFAESYISLEVVEAYELDKPEISVYYTGLDNCVLSSVCYDAKLNVSVIGGTAPYLYKFSFDDGQREPMLQDYSADNSFAIDVNSLELNVEYPMTVYVKDAEDIVSEKTVIVVVSEPIQ